MTDQHRDGSRLQDLLTHDTGQVFCTGIRALARLPIDQLRVDREAGHSTAAVHEAMRTGAVAMAVEFQMPELGPTTEEGSIIEWLVEEGAHVTQGTAIPRGTIAARMPSPAQQMAQLTLTMDVVMDAVVPAAEFAAAVRDRLEAWGQPG